MTSQVRRKREAVARVPLPDRVAAGLDDGRQRAELGYSAAVWVAGYRRRHGYGPTWAELAEVLHPDCYQRCGAGDDDPRAVVGAHTHQVVARLRNTRWLSASRQARSLDIGARLAKHRSQLEEAAGTPDTAETATGPAANNSTSQRVP